MRLSIAHTHEPAPVSFSSASDPAAPNLSFLAQPAAALQLVFRDRRSHRRRQPRGDWRGCWNWPARHARRQLTDAEAQELQALKARRCARAGPSAR